MNEDEPERGERERKPARAMPKREWGKKSAGERYVERKVDDFLLVVFLIVFAGAGIAVGYPLYHRQHLESYWYVPVIGILVAAGGGYAFLKPMAKKGGYRWVGWLFGILITFALGFYLGATSPR